MSSDLTSSASGGIATTGATAGASAQSQVLLNGATLGNDSSVPGILKVGNGVDGFVTATAAGSGALDLSTIIPLQGGVTGTGAVVLVSNGSVIGLTSDAHSRMPADVANATATFANMTGLLGNLTGGVKYAGEMIVKCNDSVAAEGMKFDFNGGNATMTSFWAAAGILTGGTLVVGTAISTSLAGVINFTTVTGETIFIVKLSLVCNVAGTLIPRFAQNTHATGTATAVLGTFLTLDRVA